MTRLSSLLFLGLVVSPVASADWFYTAAKIQCDKSTEAITITNVSAYNKEGIKTPDEKRGIFVTLRTAWPKKVPYKEYRCKTKSTEFVVRIAPVFANNEVQDTLEVAVIRNGEMILKYTELDSDEFGMRPNSYVISITVKSTGSPIVERSCRDKVHLGAQTCRT